VPPGRGPRRRPDQADDGGRARRLPGAVGHRHPAPVRRLAAHPHAHAARLPHLPAALRRCPPPGGGEGMSTTTPPPLDPAIALALAADPDAVVGMTAEDIPVLRARAVPVPEHEVTRYGTFERTDLRFRSAADGAPVPVVLLRPVQTSGPLPVLFHIPGGGL